MRNNYALGTLICNDKSIVWICADEEKQTITATFSDIDDLPEILQEGWTKLNQIDRIKFLACTDIDIKPYAGTLTLHVYDPDFFRSICNAVEAVGT